MTMSVTAAIARSTALIGRVCTHGTPLAGLRHADL
jgi:hypothetical protein